MNQLQVIEQNGQLLVGSREVAEMIGKRHSDLLVSIEIYCKHLANGNFRLPDFFIKSNYRDAQGKERPCYLLTRKGCDMVANKLTGEKGVLFTAAYVTRFEEMEKGLTQPKMLSEREQLIASMKLTIETSEELSQVKNDVANLKETVNNKITLDHGEQQALNHQIKKRVESIAGDYLKDMSKQKLYSQIHSHLRRAFTAPSYRVIKSKDFDDAVAWVRSWRPLL